jgi:predicted metal-dependent HD superfamily phosphohydrolase
MATTDTGLGRFQSLWQRNLIEGAVDNSPGIYQRLLQYYGEPHRHYHSMDHIEHCLGQFDQCRSLARDADALELAIWFHDIILVCGRHDNESRSAELYLELADGAHPDTTRQLVNRLIMATLHDGGSLDDADSRLMVDIDLSSFGLPWDDFLRDSLNLRAENPQLSDADYYLNQTGFQRALLARPRFFLSDFFHDRFETQARANLARYFEYLQNSHQA